MTGSISIDLAQQLRVPRTQTWAQRYARLLIAVDLLAVFLSLATATIVGDIDGSLHRDVIPGLSTMTVVSVTVGIAWMLMLYITGSRSARVFGIGGTEYQRVLVSTFAVFGTAGIVAYLVGVDGLRVDLVTAAVVGVVALVVGRWACRQWLTHQRAAGRMSNRVLLVGSQRSIEQTARDLARASQAGLLVVGACTPSGSVAGVIPGTDIPVRGSMTQLMSAVEAVGADTVIITSSNKLSSRAVRELSWQLEPGRQHLIVAPSLTDIGGPRLHTRPVAGLPLIHVETPRYEGGKLYVKRVFDVVSSGALILLLLPVLLAVAFAVRSSSPGPAFFRQERVGLRGERFHMLKFRSMYIDAEERLKDLTDMQRGEGNDIMFKMKDDPRVTSIGKVIRRYSLDELPQLFNVFLGEMSLVGPRPPLDREVSQYARHVHRRFLVKPGITGLWQVSGRSNLNWEETVRLDLFYVENWTMTGDLVILWKTVRSVLQSDGAY